LTVAVLVLFLIVGLTLTALFRLLLAGLATLLVLAVLTGLTGLLTRLTGLLTRLTRLLTLSELTALLTLFFRIVCHDFLLRMRQAKQYLVSLSTTKT
jgi:hypothetical protein